MEKQEDEKTTPTYRERVLDAVSNKDNNKTVPISFPRPVFKKFNQWAFENASGCYWLAIEKLLANYDEQKLDVVSMINMLADRDVVLANEIDTLRQQVEALTNDESKSKSRHFGRKEGE